MSEISRRILCAYDELKRDSLDLHALFETVGGNDPKRREAVLDVVTELVKEKLLREEESDFYSRTDEGRLAVVDPREITIYTREGCTLCEEARQAILPLVREFGAKLSEVDIDDDPALHDRYTNDVPVIFLGSQFVGQHRVDVARLSEKLSRLKN
jgi:glutaredoxin